MASFNILNYKVTLNGRLEEIYFEIKWKYKSIIRLFYTIFWIIKKPTIVNTKHPLCGRIQIFDEYGKMIMTIQEYNNKTKDALIFPTDGNGKLINPSRDMKPIKVNLPKSTMKLTI